MRKIFEHLDICNEEGLANLFRKYSFDSVIHLAAESHVDRSILNPRDFIENILVKKLKVSHVVTGFDFVFGNQQSGNVKTMKAYSRETGKFLFTKVP